MGKCIRAISFWCSCYLLFGDQYDNTNTCSNTFQLTHASTRNHTMNSKRTISWKFLQPTTEFAITKTNHRPCCFQNYCSRPILGKKMVLVNVLVTCFLIIYSYGIHFSGRSEKDYFIHSKTVSARNTTQKWWMLVLENNFLKVFCKKDMKTARE